MKILAAAELGSDKVESSRARVAEDGGEVTSGPLEGVRRRRKRIFSGSGQATRSAFSAAVPLVARGSFEGQRPEHEMLRLRDGFEMRDQHVVARRCTTFMLRVRAATTWPLEHPLVALLPKRPSMCHTEDKVRSQTVRTHLRRYGEVRLVSGVRQK